MSGTVLLFFLSRGSGHDRDTSLSKDSDQSEGEVLRMSSALPTMWLGAQNGW